MNPGSVVRIHPPQLQIEKMKALFTIPEKNFLKIWFPELEFVEKEGDFDFFVFEDRRVSFLSLTRLKEAVRCFGYSAGKIPGRLSFYRGKRALSSRPLILPPLPHETEEFESFLIKEIQLRGCIVEGEVVLDESSFVEPGACLRGPCFIKNSTIKSKAVIGPFCWIENSLIESGATVYVSWVEGAVVGRNAHVGPFTHLREGTVIEEACRVGNFVEIKKSRLGKKVAAAHLSYIGDATVGEETNIGAGTITCNYDGARKNPTFIGKRVFVGSNTAFVAPVRIGDNSVIAAGSVITSNVPAWSLGIARSKQVVKEGWAKKWWERIRRIKHGERT